MIATEKVATKTRLKIKIGCKKIEQVSLGYECGQSKVKENDNSDMHKQHNRVATDSALKKRQRSDPSVVEQPATPHVNHCAYSEMVVGAKEKKQKLNHFPNKEKRKSLDHSVKQQCIVLLNKLMVHPSAWLFNEPVDPVKFHIPDYFNVIKEPMDFGTIKSKLQKNVYGGYEEFVADIKLTFSNALRYNPPDNHVHHMAKELNKLFDARWKTLEAKLKQASLKVAKGCVSSEIRDKSCSREETMVGSRRSLMKSSMAYEEKQHEVKLASRRAQNFPHKSLGNSVQKGIHNGNPRACAATHMKAPVSPIARTCSLCGSLTCQCTRRNDTTHASSSDLSSERSLGGDHRASHDAAAKLDSLPKDASASQMTKSDPDSDGAVSALDEENICLSSQIATRATVDASEEGWETPAFYVPLSPKKALRAAMLKSRFATTILKAQQKTLLDHGDVCDPVKMQQEKDRMERKQREEKERIEAQIIAAEAASRKKAEAESKMRREREREAARIALQKMERTVEIDENQGILKDLELFKNSNGCFDGEVNPLERLGLYIKSDYLGDGDEDEYEEEIAVSNNDGVGEEEGEIVS